MEVGDQRDTATFVRVFQHPQVQGEYTRFPIAAVIARAS